MIYLVSLIVGLSIGLASTFIGIGGGILIVSFLPAWTSLTQHEAIATSLLTIFLIVARNCLRFSRQNLINWPLSIKMGLLSSVLAWSSGAFAHFLSEFQLQLILVGVIFSLLVWSLMTRPTNTGLPKRGLIFFSGVAGALSGLTGIGSGILMSPYLSTSGMVPSQQVVPTVNGIMLFTTLAGALAFLEVEPLKGWQLGAIHLDLVAIMFFSSYLTAHVGFRYQKAVSHRVRRWLLHLALILFFLKIFYALVNP